METIVQKVVKAKKVIKQAIGEFGDDVAIACSFGKDSMVTVHLALTVNPKIRVFSVMTPFKPQATLEYLEAMRERYKINLKIFKNNMPLNSGIMMRNGKGTCKVKDLHKHDPDYCCELFKVDMTKQAIRNMRLKAWMCGLRKDEGRTRIDYKHFERNKKPVKINPILDFTETDVWKYHAMFNIPVHPWYKLGYRSLGCAPCTVLCDDSDEERAGRWKDTSKCGGECGIHSAKDLT